MPPTVAATPALPLDADSILALAARSMFHLFCVLTIKPAGRARASGCCQFLEPTRGGFAYDTGFIAVRFWRLWHARANDAQPDLQSAALK
jgi:hypothetical protein